MAYMFTFARCSFDLGLVDSDTSHLQVFGKQIVLLNTFHACSFSAVITEVRMGREQKSRHTLAERLIHKVCSEIALSRTQISLDDSFSRVCKLLPVLLCWSLCVRRRELPESLRNHELPFLPSNSPVRSAGRRSFWLSRLRLLFSLNSACNK